MDIIDANTNKLYTSLIMEFRPMLQSANIFIKLKKCATSDFNISLNTDSFEMIQNNVHEKVPVDFDVLANSLSCLRIQDKSVTFRFTTCSKNRHLGTANAEIIKTTKTNLTVEENNSFLNCDLEFIIQCTNCLQLFSQEIKFERTLPLPSERCDPGEWFCHGHDNNKTLSNLHNKHREIFYSNCYAHVNKDLLNGVIKNEKILTCKRCLSWIGIILTSKMHKIWFNTVTFLESGVQHCTNPLKDVFTMIRKVLNDSLLNSVRILLHCQANESRVDYVLLWVMEKRLNVCFNVGKHFDIAKVLFKFNSAAESSVLMQWKNDLSVDNISISKLMMVRLLEHLFEMNNCLPKDFSFSNDFYVSYLSLYEEENK